MSLSVALVALIWSHFRPHKWALPLLLARRWHVWLLENFNGGHPRHGVLAWGAGVLLPALFLAFLGRVLGDMRWFLEVLLLYTCLDFHAASLHAASIARALTLGDLPEAHAHLEGWRPGMVADEEVVARVTVEETLKIALASLLGLLFWYFLFGVVGVVVYRLALLCREVWHEEALFDRFALQIMQFLDWLPVRAAAFSFAIVGNFQDALDSWRGQAHGWGDENQGILLAAGAGALGIRLGGMLAVSGGELLRPWLGVEEAATAKSIEGSIALVWRATLLWLALVSLLWLGSL